MTSPTTPEPPYQPQTGWAGMAQHAQHPMVQQPQPVVRHSSTPGLIAIGAGAATLVGSFLPWATVSTLFGSMSMSGTDGSDGWVTVVVGLLLVAYGVAARTRRVSTALDILAVLAGVGTLVWAMWHVYDVQQIDAAARVNVGIGLWLVAAGGVVAACGIGDGMIRRRRP